MTEQHVGRRIARAMVIIFIFQVFWKFGGFIVTVLAFRQFGSKADSYILDAYTFAESTIIWTLYVFFDKFIFPTFLPLFSEERELKGDDAGWKFVNSFVNLLMIVLIGTIAMCMYWAPQVVDWIAHDWVTEHPGTADLAVQFSRWMLPGLFFLALGSFTYALLNAHKRFAHAAAGAAMHRLLQAAIFAVAFWLFKAPAIWAALAFVLASPAKLLTHFVGLKDMLRKYRPTIPYWRPVVRGAARWIAEFIIIAVVVGTGCRLAGSAFLWPASPDFGVSLLVAGVLFVSGRGLISWFVVRLKPDPTLLEKLYLLAYPVLMGVLIARARDIVQDSYATGFEESGLFGAIKIAKRVGELPTAIIPVALSMAMFPFLCDMFTKQNLRALAEVVAGALKMIVLFFVPLTVVVVILRLPLIEVLASSKVEPGLVGATALALALYSLSFVFYAAETVLMQSFFSLQNTWLPTVIGGVASFAQIGFMVAMFRVLEGPETAAQSWMKSAGITSFIVVAAAFPLSRAAKNLVLGSVLHVRLKLFHARDLTRFVPQVLVVTAVTGLAAWALWHGVAGLKPSGVAKIVRLALPGGAALVAFVGTLFALRRIGWPVAEFEQIVHWLHETGWQKVRAKWKGGKQ